MIYAASVVPVTLIILAVINAFLHGPYVLVRQIIQIAKQEPSRTEHCRINQVANRHVLLIHLFSLRLVFGESSQGTQLIPKIANLG